MQTNHTITDTQDPHREAREVLADLCDVDTADMTPQQLLDVATRNLEAAQAEGDALTAKMLGIWVLSLQNTPTVH